MAYTDFNDGDTPDGDDFDGNWEWGFWGQAIYDADTGGDDNYVATLTPAPPSYLNGMTIRLKVTTGNTGAATLNINSLGAKTIKKNVSDDLETGDIDVDQLITVCYDGTNFQLVNQPCSEKLKVAIDSSATPDYLGASNSVGALRVDGTTIQKTDGGNYITLSTVNTRLLFTGSLSEEANELIYNTAIENKWVKYELVLWSNGAGYSNEGAVFVGESETPSAYGIGIPANGDNQAYAINASGFFYAGSGIAAPGSTDAIPASQNVGIVYDASLQTHSRFTTDCFLYIDSTTKKLTLHVGSCTTSTLELNILFEVFDTSGSLGD